MIHQILQTTEANNSKVANIAIAKQTMELAEYEQDFFQMFHLASSCSKQHVLAEAQHRASCKRTTYCATSFTVVYHEWNNFWVVSPIGVSAMQSVRVERNFLAVCSSILVNDTLIAPALLLSCITLLKSCRTHIESTLCRMIVGG